MIGQRPESVNTLRPLFDGVKSISAMRIIPFSGAEGTGIAKIAPDPAESRKGPLRRVKPLDGQWGISGRLAGFARGGYNATASQPKGYPGILVYMGLGRTQGIE